MKRSSRVSPGPCYGTTCDFGGLVAGKYMIPIRFFGNLKIIPRSLYLSLRIPPVQGVLGEIKALSAKGAPG